MKRKDALILIAIIALLTSCKKDPIISTDKQVGISKITYYPNFELTGDAVMSIIKGSSFTDPGVKATAGGVEVPVTTTGSVDAGTAGLYVLTYTATNADGYSGSVTRTVVVIPSAENPGVDLSGNYSAVSASAGSAIITKVAQGVYYTTNCWNGATVIPVYFICLDGSSITIPTQATGFGRIQTDTPGTYVNGLISWDLDLVDIGIVRTRKWQKQ